MRTNSLVVGGISALTVFFCIIMPMRSVLLRHLAGPAQG